MYNGFKRVEIGLKTFNGGFNGECNIGLICLNGLKRAQCWAQWVLIKFLISLMGLKGLNMA